MLGQACRQFVPSVLRRQRTFPIVEELPDQVPQAVGFLGARVAGRPVECEIDNLLIIVSFGGCSDRGRVDHPTIVRAPDPFRLQHVDRCRHMRPEAGAGAGFQTGHLPDSRNVLAGESSAEDVHRWHRVPVDQSDVAKVRASGQWREKTRATGSLISENQTVRGVGRRPRANLLER